MCATRKVSDLWMSRAARASAFHWNLIGIQVPRREGCLDSRLLLPSPWGGSFSTRAFLHARRVAEFRGRRDVPPFETRRGGEKGFGSVRCQRATGRNEIPRAKLRGAFTVFVYRYSFQFTILQRRSIDQGKKKKEKKNSRSSFRNSTAIGLTFEIVVREFQITREIDNVASLRARIYTKLINV